jgi:hypothetical protein
MSLRTLLCASCVLLVPAAALGQNPASQTSQASQSDRTPRQAPQQKADWLMPAAKPGAPLRVVERSGNATTGKLLDVLPSAIRLSSGGVIREVPLSEIASVRRNGDSLWNGIAWGGGVAGLMVVGYNGDCDTCYSAAELAAYRLAVVGIGAGLGALLDVMVRDKRILYQAPGTPSASRRLKIHPFVAGHARGLLLSVHW